MGPKLEQVGVVVPEARFWAVECVTSSGLAYRSERLGRPGPVHKGKGFGWARQVQGPSIEVRGARLAWGLSIKVIGWKGRVGPGGI